jgi:hypothetical protein
MTDYDVMTDKGIQDTNIQVALLGHNNNASIPRSYITNSKCLDSDLILSVCAHLVKS